MNRIGVQYALPRRGLPASRSFSSWVNCVLDELKTAGDLCVRIVDQDEGQALNRDWRGKDYATNVLSFPAEAMVDEQPWLGDLALCAPVIAREAQEQSKSTRAHYAHLTVHGLLHLLGYDHQEDAQAAQMEALETRLLAKLGIADPYMRADSY